MCRETLLPGKLKNALVAKVNALRPQLRRAACPLPELVLATARQPWQAVPSRLLFIQTHHATLHVTFGPTIRRRAGPAAHSPVFPASSLSDVPRERQEQRQRSILGNFMFGKNNVRTQQRGQIALGQPVLQVD